MLVIIIAIVTVATRGDYCSKDYDTTMKHRSNTREPLKILVYRLQQRDTYVLLIKFFIQSKVGVDKIYQTVDLWVLVLCEPMCAG